MSAPPPQLVAPSRVETLADIKQESGHGARVVTASMVFVALLLQEEPPHGLLAVPALARMVIVTSVSRHPIPNEPHSRPLPDPQQRGLERDWPVP